jgi:hypothetical protein
LTGTLETRLPILGGVEGFVEFEVHACFGNPPLFAWTLVEVFGFAKPVPVALILSPIPGLTAPMGGVGGGRVGALRLAGRFNLVPRGVTASVFIETGGVVVLDRRVLTFNSFFGVVASRFGSDTRAEVVFGVEDWGSSGESDFLGNVLPKDEVRAETFLLPFGGVFSPVDILIALSTGIQTISEGKYLKK